MVYSIYIGAQFPTHRYKLMIIQQVRQAKAAEKTAKDAFYAQHAVEAKLGSKPSAKYFKLQAAMVAATNSRQAAMTAYADALQRNTFIKLLEEKMGR